jgi:HEAT repeat protein
VAAVQGERWPFARRAQVTALGALCAPGTGEVLIRADEHDLPEVRRAALEGLARCRDPRAPALLLRHLGRRAEDPELRAMSARLLGGMSERGQRPDPTLAPKLAEILARLRVESQADVALEGVAVVALQALVRLGGPAAIEGARGLLADERPGLRRAALEALGTLCDGREGARAVEKAASDPDPAVAAAAVAARRRCRER